MEDPDVLLRRLRLGREEYCQRLLTMLILDGAYPRWRCEVCSASSTALSDLSHASALGGAPVTTGHDPEASTAKSLRSAANAARSSGICCRLSTARSIVAMLTFACTRACSH